MLIFKTNDKEHRCETVEFKLILEYEIEPGWREAEIAASASLQIATDGYFTIPRDKIAQDLFSTTGEKDELLTTQFELSHVEFDVKRGVITPMSSLPFFPGLEDFASMDFPKEVCDKSMLWIGNFPRATNTQIRFTASETAISSLEISGAGSWYDMAREKEYPYQYCISEKNVPFAIRFLTRSAKTDFPRLKKIAVLKELRDCFTARYGHRCTQYNSSTIAASDKNFIAVEFTPQKL